MSSTLTEAVGTDTFGGLSGYKRDLQGNPTRVPSNLPAFRGRPNKPGAEIRARRARGRIRDAQFSGLRSRCTMPTSWAA